MSDVLPASAHSRFPLPRCGRVALAALSPPGTDETSRPFWTEVIPLGDDRVGLVVADTGHHPVPVAQLRRLVAEALDRERSPVRALEALDRCVAGQPGPPVDGAAQCAVLDGPAGTLLWSGAGPRAPLVVGPAGGRLLTGGDGPAVGRADQRFRQAEETLEAGTTVVLGFPGAGDDLAASAARHHDLAPDDLAAALLAGTGAGAAPVLLLARLIPAPLAERLPADPRRLPAVRRRLGAWSAQAALSDDTTADLQLMLSEAATNSVEHAYRDGPPGEFVYSVRRRDDGAIRVEVQDFGRWRPPPADPGYRGRGLAVIHNLAGEVTLEVGESGTRVAFTVPGDPPPLAQRSAAPGVAQWWTAGSGHAR
jgi:anti-sigma regulatory factor (Ser/Thr protein kinase)